MAYGLRKIANKSYNCYGNGRDWFFLGDPEFRGGRRTPGPNEGNARPEKPPNKGKGVPQEVQFRRACKGAKERNLERWHKLHAEVPETFGHHQLRAMAQEAPGRSPKGARTDGAPATTTYHSLGQIPSWQGDRYVLPLAEERRAAGVPRSSSEPALKEMEGDHTLGVRGANTHFVSTYMGLGQVPNPSLSRKHEVHDAQLRRAAGVPPHGEVAPKEAEGDHTLGVRGRAPHYAATYWDIGRHYELPRWVGDHHQVALCEELRDAGVPPREAAPKDMEGDHTRGIKGTAPHYLATSAELGRYQKWQGERYDFGPVAVKNYRFTRWRSKDD